MNLTILVAIIYLLSIFIVGIVSSKFFSKSEEGFYLADRGFGAIATAISAGATDTSGWIFIGAVGFSYAYGISTMWMCVGYTVGYFINYIFLAPPLRRYTRRTGVMSIPHFFEVRYPEYGKLLRTLSSIMIVIFFIIYTGAQLTSAGKAFNAIIGWNYQTAILVAAFFGTFYAFFGGYKAVVWTDVLQGCIMMIVLWVFPVMLIIQLGGWGSFWNQVAAIDPILVSATGGIKGYAGFAFAFGLFAGGLAEPGQPQILARFISAKDDKTIISSAVIAVFWVLTVMGGSSMIGIICRVLQPGLSDPEYAFPTLVKAIMHPVIAGVVLAAIFAAILSTVDSLIMVVAQTVHLDILQGVMGKDLKDKGVLWVGRATILFVGVAGTLIAISDIRMVFWFVLYSWAVMGAAFGPPIILGLYWKRVTAQGALAGIITGAVVTVVWYNVPMLKDFVYELVPALAASIAMTVIVSLMTKEPAYSQKQIDLAQSVKEITN
ncbi:MAG: sodium/proline symporter [Synergistota bacterium]|nr:sodium/proline symporter [Synergistota bacterium]